jgi:hypothetical protein
MKKGINGNISLHLINVLLYQQQYLRHFQLLNNIKNYVRKYIQTVINYNQNIYIKYTVIRI